MTSLMPNSACRLLVKRPHGNSSDWQWHSYGVVVVRLFVQPHHRRAAAENLLTVELLEVEMQVRRTSSRQVPASSSTISSARSRKAFLHLE
jgi:hypothetical protein